MPPVYTYDHIHLRTHNPQATIEYFQKMFDATPVSYVQSNGKPRVDLDLNEDRKFKRDFSTALAGAHPQNHPWETPAGRRSRHWGSSSPRAAAVSR